jgi:2-polyprenyl-3-methyl-5-hydroxy-6-metoxy-1,4-benzoquinol methylase
MQLGGRRTTFKNMQLPHSSPTPERLTQFAFAFAPPLLLQTAVELQVFDYVDQSPLSLDELCSRTGASHRGMRALLNALVGFEFLTRNQDGGYALTPESETFLVRNKPAYRGEFFTFIPGMIQHWLDLKDSVKSGQPVVAVNSEREGADFFREFVKALFNVNFAPANTLAAALKGKREVTSVLDLAAGSGVWGIVLAEQFPHARVTAVDFPAVLEVTKETADRYGVADRFHFSAGDLLVAEFGTQHDLAVLGHILHTEGESRSRQLLQKVFHSLAPGGMIAIAEWLVNETRTAPPHSLMFAVNMLIHSTEGDTFSFEEINAWLSAAGFRDAHLLDAPGVSPLILATKP